MEHLEIKRVVLDALHQDPSNARMHPEQNMDAIVGSLKRFGQVEPLVVQKGTNRVIGGNGRLAAMRKLEWTHCDVVEVEVNDLNATALGIALNRTAEIATWEDNTLAKLLLELQKQDALIGTGFKDDDIDDILLRIDSNLPPRDVSRDEEAREVVNPVSKNGDLWHLGDHRLLCGDSTKSEDLARLMDGEKAALLSTDPPYCVDYTGMDRPIHDGKPSGKDWSHVYREVDIKDLGEFLDLVFKAALPHAMDDAAIYVWHAHLQYPTIAATFEKHNLLLHQSLIWVKPVATLGHSYYRWRHEPCAFGWKRGHKPKHGYGDMDSVWEVDWEGKSRIVGNEHPTQKPLRLFEIPMEQHTEVGDIVLEPFSGSGSQLVAAEKLRRKCRAMELSPAFVDADIRRWQRVTGKEATLEGSGLTYSQVAKERGIPIAEETEET